MSAVEDFQVRNLRIFGNVADELCYLWSLYEGEGVFRHWGLEKTHGEEASRSALQECFLQALIRMTRTPFQKQCESPCPQRLRDLMEVLQVLENTPKERRTVRIEHMLYAVKTSALLTASMNTAAGAAI